MKNLLLFVLFCGLSMTAQKKKIDATQLPAPALDFVQKNFKKTALHRAYSTTDDGAQRYKAVMADDTEIDFDAAGNWIEIDGETHSIADQFIPTAILTTVKKQYPEGKIRKIEKEPTKFEIELLDGTEIDFDLNGNILPKK